MTASVVILNLAYVSLLSSTFTRTVQRLRAMLVLGAVGFVSFALLEDITSMVLWNLVIGGMHLVRLIRQQLARQSVCLSDQGAIVRDEFFADMSDFDFNLLWRLGAERTYYKTTLIERGAVPDSVMFVLEGTLDVSKEGAVMRTLGRGSLIGEMSFVAGSRASVDVTSNGPVILHEWRQQDLHSLDQVNPPAARAFRDYVSRDLTAKARL